jgi:hypothetical protein
VTWFDRFGHDGSGWGAFARRFNAAAIAPAALEVDGPGNRVLEPGETVEVRPAWRNVSIAAQTFQGALSGFSGPPGPTHTITDAVGDYGTVAVGATAPCSDCYEVSVSDPPSRPALHWDASALETISPIIVEKSWIVHVGRSFADVPPANAFYRFVETLLHNGVTGGCSPTQYCPASSTTREQMAVFVLVGKEGTGYVPPACILSMFLDLPASSPFCPFVNELARRGAVTGCGGGNYCPTQPVSREQMAVFVLRTLDPALLPPVCVPPNDFNDVPETSPFCRWVEELARRAVVTGCGGGDYCPAAPVTREQMGVFISATFGLTLYGP